MKPLRTTLVCAAAALLFAMGACSLRAQEEASSAPPGTPVAPSLSGGSSSGAGGGFNDSGIEVGAKGDGGTDPYQRFAALCGEGEGCELGDDAEACTSEGGAGGGGSAEAPRACRLVPRDGVVSAQCLPVGPFEAGGPCQTSADCAAGLGCEGAPPQGGVCRRYCCGSVESCASGTYCDARPMADPTGDAGVLLIPVCVPAVNCELLNERACPSGLTCTIVRDNGTTSCVTPGVGRAGEGCPCASGFVCSMLTDECKQLCHVGGDPNECGDGGSCQGASMAYPAGFGVCVGGGI